MSRYFTVGGASAAALLTVLQASAALAQGVTQCTGGSNIAIALDNSGSILLADFEAARDQVINFVDTTSGVDTPAGANDNIYYLNTFSDDVSATTGAFMTNADSAVSDIVDATFAYTGGQTSTDFALNDILTVRAAEGLTSGIVIVVTDGVPFSQALTIAEADALKAQGATVVAVAIGDFDTFALEETVSLGADGTPLIFFGSEFLEIASLLSDAVNNIDSDGDGVNDCLDGCPENPLKTTPDLCGCDGDPADPTCIDPSMPPGGVMGPMMGPTMGPTMAPPPMGYPTMAPPPMGPMWGPDPGESPGGYGDMYDDEDE